MVAPIRPQQGLLCCYHDNTYGGTTIRDLSFAEALQLAPTCGSSEATDEHSSLVTIGNILTLMGGWVNQ